MNISTEISKYFIQVLQVLSQYLSIAYVTGPILYMLHLIFFRFILNYIHTRIPVFILSYVSVIYFIFTFANKDLNT